MKNIRKVIIPLFLLTLLLLIGCDNQKAIDDAVKERKEITLAFIDTYDEIYGKAYLRYLPSNSEDLQYLEKLPPSFSKEFDLSDYTKESTTKEDKDALYNLLDYLINTHAGPYKATVTKAEGKVNYKKSEDGNTIYVTATDVVITYIDNNKAPCTLYVDFDVTLVTLEEGTKVENDIKREFLVSKLVVNGKEFKPIDIITYKVQTTEAYHYGSFVTAYCDGTRMNCDLLNTLGLNQRIY